MMMTYEEFKVALLKKAEEYFGEGMTFSFTTSPGVNGDVEHLVIQKNSDGNNPALRVRHLYQRYGDIGDFDQVWEDAFKDVFCEVDSVAEIVASLRRNGVPKDKVFPRLVNTGMNAGILAECPHMPFLDLSIIYVCELEGLGGRASFRIKNEMLQEMKMSVEELHALSIRNLEGAGLG